MSARADDNAGLGGLAARLRERLSRARRDEGGMVAVIFALVLVVMAPMVLGLFDVYTFHAQRARLQDALDAAALYAARSTSNDPTEIQTIGDRALNANLQLLRGAVLVSSDFQLTTNNTAIEASATVDLAELAPAFWAHPNLTVGTNVVRASKNLEVSLVLDVTNSMNSGTRIADLRTAAQDLVDIVVKDQQTPFYSKVAVVPWSAGVNLGPYADAARGAVTGTRSITGVASWMTGAQKNVSGATRANPVVVTANSHGFVNGDRVMITGVSGMTEINGAPFTVANKTTNTFQLQGINGSGYASYSSGGKVTKCVRTDCTMTVTAAGHGYANGAQIYLNNIGPSGLGSSLNDKLFAISGVTANSFNIFVGSGPTTAYTSGGDSYCTDYGCEYYRFTNGDNSAVKLFRNSACVSERTGAQAYTDTAPSVSPMGFNYPAPASGASYAGSSANTPNPCLGDQVIPLSSDKASVKASIAGLLATGSTAGQIGTAWGWYMVSPNFGYMWPNASQRPAAYGAPNTLKAVVLMTDGALNSPYCNGVIAKNALSGSGSIKDHHDCDATNGTTLAQSLALCQAMKDNNIVVYTVGFQITGDTNATTLINTCATSANHVYLPTSGQALASAFKSIGADLNTLRITR